MAEVAQFKETNFLFGVDLTKAALHHVELLEELMNVPSLNDDQLLERALWRYEYRWLPLAAVYSERSLVAPLDIEWIWHCHMLSPIAYQNDCINVVQKVIDHQGRSQRDRMAEIYTSKHLWEEMFPGEPFDIIGKSKTELDLTERWGEMTSSDQCRESIKYDLRSAVSRQSGFYYQVSLPHYTDKKFLENALLRYRKFLFLKQQNTGSFCVPSYDIDLLWHSHMTHPIIYQQDTAAILGSILNHDDSVNDRRPGSKLSQSERKTEELWRLMFNEGYRAPGSMYRGNQTDGVLSSIPDEDFTIMSTKRCTLDIDRVKILGLQGEHPRTKLQMFLQPVDATDAEINERCSKALLTLKGPYTSWHGRTMCNFVVDTKEVCGFRFILKEKFSKKCCSEIVVDIGDATCDFMPFLETMSSEGSIFDETIFLTPEADIRLSMHAEVSPPIQGPLVLRVVPEQFVPSTLCEETTREIWKSLNMSVPLGNSENPCNVALHRLVNPARQVLFSCRVVHAPTAMVSAFQVFFRDHPVAFGHLVATDQLPLQTMVERGQEGREKCVSLKEGVGERAVLIKNSSGDWGILVGSWEGFRKGEPASTGNNQGVAGSPGHLKVKLFKLSTKSWDIVQIYYEMKDYKGCINNMKFDLKSGMVELKPDQKEVAENLAVVFGISFLHVLCQPRPRDWTPGQKSSTPDMRGDRTVTAVPSKDMAFVMAAGYTVLTPSNHYIVTCDHLPNDITEASVGDSGAFDLKKMEAALHGGCAGCGSCTTGNAD